VKLSDHLLRAGRVFDLLSNKGRDLLDNIYQGHRWPPVLLLLWNDMQQQVPSVRQGGSTKLTILIFFITLVRVVMSGGWKGNLSLKRISKLKQ